MIDGYPKRLTHILSSLLLCSCLCPLSSAVQRTNSPIDFFVDPVHGSDSFNGTVSFPFRTLPRARSAIRDLQPLQQPVNVNLRGGVYDLADPFILEGIQDSGSQTAPITYRGTHGEHVLLSGGRQVNSHTSSSLIPASRRLPFNVPWPLRVS